MYGSIAFQELLHHQYMHSRSVHCLWRDFTYTTCNLSILHQYIAHLHATFMYARATTASGPLQTALMQMHALMQSYNFKYLWLRACTCKSVSDEELPLSMREGFYPSSSSRRSSLCMSTTKCSATTLSTQAAWCAVACIYFTAYYVA